MIAGLDEMFIHCLVEELKDGETVSVFGCTDQDAFEEYIENKYNIIVDTIELYDHRGKYLNVTMIEV